MFPSPSPLLLLIFLPLIKPQNCNATYDSTNLKSYLNSLPTDHARSTFLEKILSDVNGDTLNDDPDNNAVRTLYELQPYPPRLHKRHKYGHSILVECLPSVIQAAVYGGKAFHPDHRYRILIVGGGTGDPTLSCAHSFEQLPIEVVHLDLSSQSNKIARQRVLNLIPGLAETITFVRGSISRVANIAAKQASSRPIVTTTNATLEKLLVLDTNNPQHSAKIAALFTTPFDYIHSTGVLHHNTNPLKSLQTLAHKNLLKEDGGLGLWVYASGGGRAGIHGFQKMMAILVPKQPSEAMDEDAAWQSNSPAAHQARHRLRKRHKERMDVAWDLLDHLPETNRLVRNPVLWKNVRGWLKQHQMEFEKQDTQSKENEEAEEVPRWDVRLSDMFLNPVDREFSVREVQSWLFDAGLRPAAWLDTDSGHFDLSALEHMDKVVSLNQTYRLALGELFMSTNVGHRVIAVRKTNEVESLPYDASLPVSLDAKKFEQEEERLLNEYAYFRL